MPTSREKSCKKEKPLKSDRKMVIKSGINLSLDELPHTTLNSVRSQRTFSLLFYVKNYHNAAHDYDSIAQKCCNFGVKEIKIEDAKGA